MCDGNVPIEAAFHYCPRCGTGNPSPGSVPFRCAECGLMNFFGPVAAVGALIVNPRGELLLVRRARDPGRGLWGLPGGFVDRGETIEAALEREVFEETRLQLSGQELLMTFPNQYLYRGISVAVIDLFFVARVADPDQLRLEPEELDLALWTHPTRRHLDRMAFASNRVAIEHWLTRNSEESLAVEAPEPPRIGESS